MQSFPIILVPDPRLRQRSRILTTEEILTSDFQNFLDQLRLTMEINRGVGIAAPQAGMNIRAIILNIDQHEECLLNPEIIKMSSALAESEEGCLSVPGTFGIVLRHKRVTVRALNRHGRRADAEFKNFVAFVVQHEIDHLNGVLFIDKTTKIIKTKVRNF